MRVFRYLKENLLLITFFLILMVFTSIMEYYNALSSGNVDNLPYIVIVLFFILLIYLIIDFTMKNHHMKKLIEYRKEKDVSPTLPKAIDYKEELYVEIIEDMYKAFMEEANDKEKDYKENIEFITAWVHEIKTPITCSLLLLDAKEDYKETLKEQIDAIEDYVEKILFHTRCNEFSSDYIISDVCLNRIVKDSVKKHSIIFIKKKIRLSVNISEELIVATDKKWLSFILDQLISNALKYTAVGNSISIYAEKCHQGLNLTVEDTGIGISQKDINKVFEFSYTGENGREENSKATGLGLYLCRKLCRKLGHKISITSELGKGTAVTLQFLTLHDYFDARHL